MTALELQVAFELEANIIDSKVKPLTSDISYWLTRAQEKFIKTRYSGNNEDKTAFEQSQKRIDDLRSLIKEVSISTSVGGSKPNAHTAILPDDYMFRIGEECDIQYVVGSTTIVDRMGITEITTDRYTQEVVNPYSEYKLIYDWAYPLRLFYDNTIELMSDGTYTIPTYYLRYLSKPNAIVLPSTTCLLPEHTHSEIVKMAVGMYLENIKSDRYNSINNEINTMS